MIPVVPMVVGGFVPNVSWLNAGPPMVGMAAEPTGNNPTEQRERMKCFCHQIWWNLYGIL